MQKSSNRFHTNNAFVEALLLFEKKIYFHNTISEKKYVSNTTHTIQKAKTKTRKKKLELLKNGKKWGVATMSFVQSRDLIYSSCLSYILLCNRL